MQRVGLIEQRQDLLLLPGIERLGDRPLNLLEGVRQGIAGSDGPGAARRSKNQENGDEDHVDQTDGGFVEVVVVRREELPQFVDEGAESDAGQNRRQAVQRPTQEREQQNEGHQHEGPAPQHVSYVQAVSAKLRVSGCGEERANPQHRTDGGYEEELEELPGLRVVRQPMAPALKSLVGVSNPNQRRNRGPEHQRSAPVFIGHRAGIRALEFGDDLVRTAPALCRPNRRPIDRREDNIALSADSGTRR